MIATSNAHADIDSYLPRVPILTAAETARVLGYPSTGALAKARQSGRLPIEMFQVPGRRGWFAATSVVRSCPTTFAVKTRWSSILTVTLSATVSRSEFVTT